MKVRIKMPPGHWDGFLTSCADRWPLETAVLMNGVLTSQPINDTVQQQIAITCERHEAYSLLVIAQSLNLPAAEDIWEALPVPVEE